MAFTKAHTFNSKDYHLSLICRALSHPARIVIVRTLLKYNKCRVKKLSRDIPLSNPSMSQHLSILLNMNFLLCDESTPTVYYEINPEMKSSIEVMQYLILTASEIIPVENQKEIFSASRFMHLQAKGKAIKDIHPASRKKSLMQRSPSVIPG